MITRFHVDNFKSLRDFDLYLNPGLTVIIGPNGSGKTSICQAMAMLGRLVEDRPADVIRDVIKDIKDENKDWKLIQNKWMDSSKVSFIVEVEDDQLNGFLNSDLISTWFFVIGKKRGWGVASELVSHVRKTDYTHKSMVLENMKKNMSLYRSWRDIKIRKYNPEEKAWESFIGEKRELPSYISTIPEEAADIYPVLWSIKQNVKIKYIPFLNPVNLRKRTRDSEMGDTGENFASYLGFFKDEHPDEFDATVKKLRKFFPWLQKVTPVRTKFGWTEVQVTVKPDKKSDNVIFKASQVNDGLLRLLALATIPYSEPDLKVLVFEEPENGLHSRLIDATVELLRSFKDIQIVLTTHSPVLLNFLKPEEVVVLAPRGKEGPVAIPFTALDEGMKRLDYFDIGDIIYNVGEHRLTKKYLDNLKKKNNKRK